MVLIRAGTRLESPRGVDTYASDPLRLRHDVRCRVFRQEYQGRRRSCVHIDGNGYVLPKGAQVVKERPIPPSVRDQMQKESVWEFSRPWTYVPFETMKPTTRIAQGKRITIAGRCRAASVRCWGTAVRIRFDPEFADLFELRHELPIEVWPFLTLVEPAKIERWRLVDGAANPITEKVFPSLASAKSSAAVRFGLSPITPVDRPDINKGVWAEELDPTGAVTSRIDLLRYLVMRKLKS